MLRHCKGNSQACCWLGAGREATNVIMSGNTWTLGYFSQYEALQSNRILFQHSSDVTFKCNITWPWGLPFRWRCVAFLMWCCVTFSLHWLKKRDNAAEPKTAVLGAIWVWFQKQVISNKLGLIIVQVTVLANFFTECYFFIRDFDWQMCRHRAL